MEGKGAFEIDFKDRKRGEVLEGQMQVKREELVVQDGSRQVDCQMDISDLFTLEELC